MASLLISLGLTELIQSGSVAVVNAIQS